MRSRASRTCARQGLISVGLAAGLGGVPLVGVLIQDWYVDVNARGCGTGTGMQADPFCDVMDAVAAASDGDAIHIAPGTYFENVVIDEDLELIGTGGASVTILDGSFSGSVVSIGSTAVVSLSGLTLTHGAGTISGVETAGGGLFVEDMSDVHDSLPRVTLTQCDVTGNSADWGAGVYFVSVSSPTFDWSADGRLDLESSSVSNNIGNQVGGVFTASTMTVRDSTISENTGAFCGGVISQSGSLTLAHSSVTENVATGTGGLSGGLAAVGGVYALSGTACDVINSLVIGNTAFNDSSTVGGIDSRAPLTLVNSTIVDNSAVGSDVAIGGVAGSCRPLCSGGGIVNSIVWNNSAVAVYTAEVDWSPVEYSLVPAASGNGNIYADPLFVDPLNGNYRLQPGSPCIDAGDNTAVPPSLTHDLRGAPRFIDDPFTPDTGVGPALVVDMGAFEFFRRYRAALGAPVQPAPPRTVP